MFKETLIIKYIGAKIKYIRSTVKVKAQGACKPRGGAVALPGRAGL